MNAYACKKIEFVYGNNIIQKKYTCDYVNKSDNFIARIINVLVTKNVLHAYIYASNIHFVTA